MKNIFDFIFLSVSHSDMYECKNKQLKVKMLYSKMLQSIKNYSKHLWFHSMHYSLALQKITLGDCLLFNSTLSHMCVFSQNNFSLFTKKKNKKTHNIDHNHYSKMEGKKTEN